MTTTPSLNLDPSPDSIQYNSLVLELDRFEGPQPDDTANADEGEALVVFSDSDGNNVLKLATMQWMKAGRPGLVRVMMWSAV